MDTDRCLLVRLLHFCWSIKGKRQFTFYDEKNTTMILKKNSWHYFLACNGGMKEYHMVDGKIDFCLYARLVFNAFFVLSLAAIVIGIAIISIIIGAVSILEMIMAWKFIEPQGILTNIGLAIISVTMLALLYTFLEMTCLRLHEIVKSRKMSGGTPKESFISLAYKSFKDKVCFIVELK